jgi:chromosome segregation ATPase
MVEHATARAASQAPVAPPEVAVARTEVAPAVAPEVERVVSAPQETVTVQQKIARQLAQAPVAQTEVSRAADTRERREKLRERLKAATAKVEPSQPTPQSPAEARTSALALISQLRQELEDSQKLSAALTKDLDATRADLARSAEEARARTFEAARMANEVAERARLIDELGKEMSSLESERDDTLVELQTSRTETEKLTGVRKELEARLAAREAELAETLTEEERLAAELEARNVELRQVQQALAGVSEERDKLSRQVADLTRERTDLLDSQKALDEIHRALADARARMSSKS